MPALIRSSALLLTFILIPFVGAEEQPFDAARAAQDILDDSLEAEKREQLVAASVPHAAAVVLAMTRDMPDDQTEEYRRIPWIWRVAVAAGKENNPEVLRELLHTSLPVEDKPLDDWRAVVIGGGIINGISQAGGIPIVRMEELLSTEKDKESYRTRWQRTIELSAAMVEDAETPSGTRYDALRILGAADWQTHGALITKYLVADAHEELQMGAVSAAGDMIEDDAALALIDNMAGLTEGNRSIAIDALFEPFRTFGILQTAVQDGRVPEEWLSAEQKKNLSTRRQR
jgi:hypothetical protein